MSAMMPKPLGSTAPLQPKPWGCSAQQGPRAHMRFASTRCHVASLQRTHHVQHGEAPAPQSFHYFDPHTLELVEVAASGVSNGSRMTLAPQEVSLGVQLDALQGRLAKMQQVEVLYRESRVRTKQLQSEVIALTELLAERDEQIAQLQDSAMAAAGSATAVSTQPQGASYDSDAACESIFGGGGSFGDGADVAGLQEALAHELWSNEGSVFGAIVGTGPGTSSPEHSFTAANGLSKAGAGGKAVPSPKEVLSGLQTLAQQIAESMEREGASLGLFADVPGQQQLR